MIRQGTGLFSQVPTAAMRAGNLSASPTQIYDPATGNPNGTGRTPFPNKMIPADRIDAGIQALLNLGLWPNPNVAGTGALGLARNYFSQGSSGQNRNQVDSKLTWNANDKLAVFARFGINDNSWFNPQQYGALGGPGFSPSNSAVGTGGGFIYSGRLSATYIFSPNLVADAYYGYSRNNAFTAPQRLNENLGWTLLKIPGLQSAQTREGGWPALIIDGFGTAGAGQIPGSKHQISHQVVADLLHDLGYSLQANRKTREGSSHPDRNAQFEHLNGKVKWSLARRYPVISVDTKKKELVGNFKNNGRELRPAGDPEKVLCMISWTKNWAGRLHTGSTTLGATQAG